MVEVGTTPAGTAAAPGVSITVINGSLSSAASRIPRLASRSASGPSGCASVWSITNTSQPTNTTAAARSVLR